MMGMILMRIELRASKVKLIKRAGQKSISQLALKAILINSSRARLAGGGRRSLSGARPAEKLINWIAIS